MPYPAPKSSSVSTTDPHVVSQVTTSEGGVYHDSQESPIISPPESDTSTPTGYRTPTGYQTSAHNSPEGSPVLRRKRRLKKELSSFEEEDMTGDKMAEISGKGGKGRVLWRPSRNVDSGGEGQRAVPPWADRDAQPPPPPSNFYAIAPQVASSSHKPLQQAIGMATSVQAYPNPTHFNRPSPGASPVAVRKSLFRTNVPLKSLSSESLNKAVPWATHKDDVPSGKDQETDQLCPMIMTGDSRSRKSHINSRVSSRSASLPRVGHVGGGESVPTMNTLPGGGYKLPDGRGMTETPPPPQPIQSEGMGERSANENQSVPRPQYHAQPGIHSSHHTGADPPDSADATQHPPGRMVSAKPTVEAKASLPGQQPEQSSPTPWRKVRAAPTDPPPEQSSPTPWRKNISSQDAAAKAAPSQQQQQQQPSWRGSKGNVSAGSVFESHTTASSAVKGQDIPWRKAASQQPTTVQSASSSTSASTTSTVVKQTQVVQKSQAVVHKENTVQVKSEIGTNLSSQAAVSQPSWRKQPPKNQPTTQPVPSAPVTSPPSAAPAAQPSLTQTATSVTSSVPTTKNVSPVHAFTQNAVAAHAINKSASPIPAVNKAASPVPTVSHSLSPVPAVNKPGSPAPTANKPASPALAVNKSNSPAPAVNKSASPSPAVNKSTSPAPAVNKPVSPAPAVNKSASPSPTVNKSASPAPAVNKPASPAPAVNKPISPIPAVNKPISPIPAVNKPISPIPAVNKPASPTPAATPSPYPDPAVDKPVTPPITTKKPATPPDIKKSTSPSPPVSAVNKPTPASPSVTEVNKTIDQLSSDETATSFSAKVSLASVSTDVDKSTVNKSGSDSSVFPPPEPAALIPKEVTAPPLAPALADTRSPTPPLPPKPTAAAIVSVPAVPLAPKPPLAPVDQPVVPPPSSSHQVIPPPPISQPILPSPPTQPILPTHLTQGHQRKSPPPGSVPASIPSTTLEATTTCVPPPPPPGPTQSSVAGPKSAESMTSVVSAPPVSLPMPVPSPPPAPVPIPPPEPVPKAVKMITPSVAAEKEDKRDDKIASKVTQITSSPPKPLEVEAAIAAPHPEFPPPPPLEESGPHTSCVEEDQTLPPPPSFIHDQKPINPMSLFTDHQERPVMPEEDFPSPEYVRESVTRRIKAFEKQASKDDESPPPERITPTARPVAPWVKKTSAGPVNQDGYWDMTSPEEEPNWSPQTVMQREAEPAIFRPRPQKPTDTTNTAAKSASIPPPPPASGFRGPPKVAPKSRGLPSRQRSTSIGEYQAQYFPPEDTKMPSESDVSATVPSSPSSKPYLSPSSTTTTPTVIDKTDESVFDPWCDPKNPRTISFQDVSAAAFKIKSGIMNTPCTRSHMSSFTDMEIYFKKEFNQYTGSFKERGARYTLLMLPDEQRKKGVIAASAGNHALALSFHGQDLGIPVTVVMPLMAPIMKVQACRQYGANIIVKGNDVGECREIALKMANDQGLLYINGYDHPHILAGQGTMGLEIVEQVQNIDAVVIPCGGGGLIAGVALAVKALYPHVKVIGVESERCSSFSGAMKAGRPVYVKAETTLADGLAVPCVGVNAFATAKNLVDKVVTVKEEWIAIAILRLVECEKAVVEGAGATALAAILAGELPELKGKRIVIPLCGGNIDTTVLGRCLERGLAADGRLVKFTVTVSDRPGGIAELTRLLANLGVSIKDMMHERAWIKNDIFSVEVKVIAETRDHDHYRQLRHSLESHYERLRFVKPSQIHKDD